MIRKHLEKNNLHHAYLIEGAREEALAELLESLKDLEIHADNNPDFVHIALDSFKIEDARSLKSFAVERGMSTEKNAKKIFVISANSFLLEAQNSLLKIFEEPIPNTHFFLIVPDINSLLKTLVSRFYVIKAEQNGDDDMAAEKFVRMSMQNRINFIKELLAEEEAEDEEGNEIVALDSTRSKAIKFLNTLESVLHKKVFIEGSHKNPKENPQAMIPFKQIFMVRKFLRQPGSSTKTLMESVALVIPDFEN